MKRPVILACRFVSLLACLPACSSTKGDVPSVDPPSGSEATSADVAGVQVQGDPGAYTFAVTVRSPDTGCDGYADWWEVVALDGGLLHRRILAHSHVDEQPFTRSGGPIDVAAEEEVVVRAHFSAGDYGQPMRGSAAGGFAEAPVDGDFAASLATAPPQPDGCAF